MKKTFFAIAFFALFSTATVFAEKNTGIVFNIDYPANLIKPTYLSETITIKHNFNETIGLDGGVRFMENLYMNSARETVLYIIPLVDFYASIWYIGAGCFIPIENDPTISFYARTGVNLGKWQWGRGIASINLGIEVSATSVIYESDDKDVESVFGTVLSSVFGTLFNIPKLNIGLTYYLPF